MDAPAMLTRKHVPENVGTEEGGQQQMHRDEKQHKPVLKKVKDKVKKIKNTIAGHGHGNGHDHDHGQDTGGSNSTEEDEEDAVMREAEVEKGGYQEDVEDKTVFSESSPELHGAPMYDSERIPAAAKHNDAPGMRLGDLGAPAAAHEVKRYDAAEERLGDFGGPAAAHDVKRDDAARVRLGDFGGPAAAHAVKRDDTQGERLGDFGGRASAKEGKRDDTQGVRLGDLGGPVVEDPAAPNSTTPMPRGGEDIGTTDVVRDFEAMTVSDDPKQVRAGNMDVDVSKEYEAMPVSDGTGEEWNDAPTDAEYTGSYTDRLKNTAAGTTEYGKKLASTVYEKVAGVGTIVASKAQQVTPGFGAGGDAQDDSSVTAAPDSMTAGAGKRDLDLTNKGTPASYTGTEELKNAAADAAGAEGLKDAATDATTESAPGATYTDKIKSAAAGTTEYSKKLASTVYEKVAGVGTAVASKGQQVMPSAGTATPGVGAQDGATTRTMGTPGVGAQDGATTRAMGTPGVGAQDGATTTATVTPGAGGPGNGQDKGVTGVTAYIAEKLRPGDEERSLSEAITGAVQQRKEGVGSTVAKAREVPAQAVTRARGAVTSLTGGNRVSETVQPTTEGNIGDGVAAEGPVLHGEAPRTNTNVM